MPALLYMSISTALSLPSLVKPTYKNKVWIFQNQKHFINEHFFVEIGTLKVNDHAQLSCLRARENCLKMPFSCYAYILVTAYLVFGVERMPSSRTDHVFISVKTRAYWNTNSEKHETKPYVLN